MSFPIIPDIKPVIELTCEDALNLLLVSIAQEEISLVKLIDAESQKIQFFVDKCKCNENYTQEAIIANNSVSEIISNIYKIEKILQSKLENVERIICAKKDHLKCKPKVCASTICHEEYLKKCECSAFGKANGVVSNKMDLFYFKRSTLRVDLSTSNQCNNNVNYFIQNNEQSLYFTTCYENIKIKCIKNKSLKVIIWGKGLLTKTIIEKSSYTEDIDFSLTLWEKAGYCNGFHIVIKSYCKSEIYHDSGFIKLKDCEKGIRIKDSAI